MFIPNVRCTIRRRAGTDMYGKSTYLSPTPAMCGIVRLEEMSDSTTVRADSSASRGSAMEETVLSRILVPAKTLVKQGDIFHIRDYKLTVQSVWPRYSIGGQLDHWQLDLTILVEDD